MSVAATEAPRLPVLVGVDGSAHSASAVAWAAAEASASGRDLVLRYAVGDEIPRVGGAQEGPRVRAAARATLEREARRIARDDPRLTVHTEVVTAPPDVALVGSPQAPLPAQGTDLVVLGRRGSGGFAKMLLGSTCLTVAGAAARPVVVVPSAVDPDTTGPESTIVVGVDPHAPCTEAVVLALDRAERSGSTVAVVVAWQVPRTAAHQGVGIPQAWQSGQALASAALEEVLRPWRTHRAIRHGLMTTRVVDGHPAGALLELQPADGLLVLGRGGAADRPGFRMGPVTWSVLHQAECPVVVVP